MLDDVASAAAAEPARKLRLSICPPQCASQCRFVVVRDAIGTPTERQHAAHFIIGNAARLSHDSNTGMIAA